MNGNDMDLLDILRLKDTEYLTGTYYARQPFTPEDDGIAFTYEMVDPKSKTYAKLINNLEEPSSVTAIRTDDDCGFEINGYVATQGGDLWIVQEVLKNVQNDNTKEALRLLTETVQTEYVIRLLKVENPWGIQ